MKICITAVGSKSNSEVDPRFGRCAYFLIFDEKGKLLKTILNEAGQAMRGAGITAAQIIADEKVDIIITGNIGPNAYMVLESSGVKILHGAFGVTVEQALEMYKKKELKEVDSSQGTGFGPGLGRGMGQGRRQGPGGGYGRRPNR